MIENNSKSEITNDEINMLYLFQNKCIQTSKNNLSETQLISSAFHIEQIEKVSSSTQNMRFFIFLLIYTT